MPLSLSLAGKTFLFGEEGCRLLAYDDARTNYTLQPGDVVHGTLTIGHGHAGPDVYIGQTITQAEADALFVKDTAPIVDAINKSITCPFPAVKQCMFDAWFSFTYNEGIHAFETSTMLRLFNSGQATMEEVAAQFLRWDLVAGKPNSAILERRKREQSMFLGNPAPYAPVQCNA